MYQKIKWDCLKLISDDEFDKNMMVIGYRCGSKNDFRSTNNYNDIVDSETNIKLKKYHVVKKLG